MTSKGELGWNRPDSGAHVDLAGDIAHEAGELASDGHADFVLVEFARAQTPVSM